MASAKPRLKSSDMLSNIAEIHAKLPSICSEIIAVKVGSVIDEKIEYPEIADDHYGDNKSEFLDRRSISAIPSGDDRQGEFASDPSTSIMDSVEVTQSSKEVDASAMEEAHDTVEEDDVGHGGDNDEDFPCETVSLTSDDISRSDSSVEEFSDYPQKIFYIHKDVLCKTSGFFHAAMKQEWSAQRTQPIDLTDVNPDLFELYVQWLYSKKVSIQAILNEENEAPVSVLVKSYILGARLADSKYQKATMKTLFLYAHKTETYPDEQTMRLAYRYTLSFDPLRKLLIDFWVCKASVTWSDGSLVERLGIEIANELIKALIERRPAPSLVEG